MSSTLTAVRTAIAEPAVKAPPLAVVHTAIEALALTVLDPACKAIAELSDVERVELHSILRVLRGGSYPAKQTYLNQISAFTETRQISLKFRAFKDRPTLFLVNFLYHGKRYDYQMVSLHAPDDLGEVVRYHQKTDPRHRNHHLVTR